MKRKWTPVLLALFMPLLFVSAGTLLLPTVVFGSTPKRWVVSISGVEVDYFGGFGFEHMEFRGFLGVGWTEIHATGGPVGVARVPLWVLASFASPLVIVRLTALRTRPANRGFCTGCGYDLRASADRCPECGLPIT